MSPHPILTIFSILRIIRPISMLSGCAYATAAIGVDQRILAAGSYAAVLVELSKEGTRMFKRTILITLIAGLFAISGGCCAFDVAVCNPYGGGKTCYEGCGTPCRGGCGASCETACEPACGPACGPTCGPACDSCSDCEPCMESCGRRNFYHGGPLGHIYRLFHPMYWQGGCGEMYWGDYFGDRPDCCDPCDRMGQWAERPRLYGNSDCGNDGCGCGCSEPAGCETCDQPHSTSNGVVVADRAVNAPGKTYRADRGARLVSRTERIVEPAKKSTRTTSTCRKGYCPTKYR